MRPIADATRLRAFMRALGEAAEEAGRVYFSGGATAVLLGWRADTIDADLLIVPDSDRILKPIPAIKDELGINVELAWPALFIPELPGWRERSPFIERHGKLDYFHYDPHSQALSKALRRQAKDLLDVREMMARGLVEPKRLWGFFRGIEGRLFRFPNIDVASFREAIEELFGPEPDGP